MIKEAAIRFNGIVSRGKRHREIIANHKHINLKKGEDGFVTSGGLFVDRKKAAEIAFQCGQIKKSKNRLISEDLY